MTVDKFRINIFDIVASIARVVNMMNPVIGNHHMQVAYLAYRLGEELRVSDDRRFELFTAGALHDIGAFYLKDRLDLLEFEDTKTEEHSIAGSLILETFEPFLNIAGMIKYHHVPWKNGDGAFQKGESVSLNSHIIHLADRVAVKISREVPVLSQVPDIRRAILAQKGHVFVPEHVDAFVKLSERENIWSDVMSDSIDMVLKQTVLYETKELSIEQMVDFSRLIYKLFDFKSQFTAAHSSGVAAVAVEMSRLSDFSKYDRRLIEIAAYLHDLGKLAIPSEILEKQDKLSDLEWLIMRSHVYPTYQALESFEMLKIAGFWGALHQERLNGTGYPFGLTSDELPLGAKIMAVADVFTALTENRPYRKGMGPDDTKMALQSMVNSGELDQRLVGMVFEHFDEMINIRDSAQKKAVADYQKFQKALKRYFDGTQ